MVQRVDDQDDAQYNEEDDPAIGFLDGPVTLSTQGKAILHAEIQDDSGWRQKPTGIASPWPTQAIWWRFGKEHGEDNFRVNPTEIIAQHLGQKVMRTSQIAATDQRWWTDGSLVVEKPIPSIHYSEDTRIYYLIERGLTIVEQVHLPPPRDHWYWYIHLADIFYDEARCCWISKDLFCDIVLDRSGKQYHVMDLADLGQALAIGLITPAATTAILQRVDTLLTAITQDKFPFPEIAHAQALCQQLGW